jgi:hypothetical protein
LAELFQSGRIIDLILLLVAAEIAALPWLLRRLGSTLTLTPLLPNILAGAALMLAVRMGLTGAHWIWIAAALGAALIAHLADLSLRLRAD